MIAWLMHKVFGTKDEREIKKLGPKVAAINEMERKIQVLSDEDLRAKTAEFRQRLTNGAKLDDLLIEAFAVCREAGKRVLNMRHFDVQLIGGMVLHRGAIAEMRTGEGKTLVATLPAYLNALDGKGVHIVTVNDYLAKRDAEWMGRIYNFLGMTVGTVVNGQGDREKFGSYRADITYGQNNEFGFDYLRDNMKYSLYDCVQRPLNFAIVDEVDSILVDEARTPLIISGQGEASTYLYVEINKIIPYLRKDEHYVIDEKGHSVTLTDEGIEEAQRRMKITNLYDPEYIEKLHVLQQCLRAHTLYKAGVNYLVEDGQIHIVDEFTGRKLKGRRWSDGLHQAVEAKEFVKVQEENRTLATITFQNLFRLYKKLAGMTGTAQTEAEEFHSIYKLDVVPIPTNKPVCRVDSDDLVYKTEREKFEAVADEIADAVQRGQPTLVGTVSVAKSEAISLLLKRRNVAHEVLNAKYHEREAYIVAQAGRKSAVTVATNMAGRGTDIVLGGNAEMLAKVEFMTAGKNPNDPALKEEFDGLVEKHQEECDAGRKDVVEAGGLHIVGTERHESRRIDNQLRGRSGRQGDPGSSRFFLSLEDDLMRIFAGDRVQSIMDSLGMEEGVPIEHPWVTRSVANAQEKVEARNFDIRKNLLEYDDVMNQQRKAVYGLRREVLEGKYTAALKDVEGDPRDPRPLGTDLEKRIDDVCADLIRHHSVPKADLEALRDAQKNGRGFVPPPAAPAANIETMEAFNAAAVEHETYLYYGVRPALEELADQPAAAKAELAKAVKVSLQLQRERLLDVVDGVVVHIVETNAPERAQRDDWNLVAMANQFYERVGYLSDDPSEAAAMAAKSPMAGLLPAGRAVWEKIEAIGTRADIAHALYDEAEKVFEAREKDVTPEIFSRVFRTMVLEEIDRAWIDHLTNMDHLRDGIGLRGYGQRDPKLEFKKEGFDMYTAMTASVNAGVIQKVFHVQVQRQQDVERLEREEQVRIAARERSMRATHADLSGMPDEQGVAEEPIAPRAVGGRGGQMRIPTPPPPPPEKIESVRRAQPKIGRNDPCFCGSGKKYKKCHGASEAGQEA